MTTADLDWLKTAASSVGVVAVLGYMLRFFMNKLEAKEAESKAMQTESAKVITTLIEKQTMRDQAITTTLERVASALDRIERRLDVDRYHVDSDQGTRTYAEVIRHRSDEPMTALRPAQGIADRGKGAAEVKAASEAATGLPGASGAKP